MPDEPKQPKNMLANNPYDGAREFGPLDVEGVTGLKQYSGIINEEDLVQLKGHRAYKTYKEMSETEPVLAAAFLIISNLISRSEVSVTPADQSPEALDRAEFLKECIGDMSHTWRSMVQEILTFLPFGFAIPEICYKIRGGPDQKDPTKRSKYSDGKIGWRKIEQRSQDSLYCWDYSEDYSLRGWVQIPPQGGPTNYIPIEKSLLFRTISYKNNPEGKSLLKGAYKPWYHKKNLERFESIGVERELAGLPYIRIPAEIMDPNASDEKKAMYESYKNIVRNLRINEQMGVVLPSDRDEHGNLLYELVLLASQGSRTIDTDKIICRYRLEMLIALLSDIVLVGHEKVGSFSLMDTKTNTFNTAMSAFKDEIDEVFNLFGVPRLFKLNGDDGPYPKIKSADLEKQDVIQAANALAQLVASGIVVPGAKDDETWGRNLAGMPQRQDVT